MNPLEKELERHLAQQIRAAGGQCQNGRAPARQASQTGLFCFPEGAWPSSR